MLFYLLQALEVLDGADKSNSEVWFAKGNILRDLNRLDDAAQVGYSSVYFVVVVVVVIVVLLLQLVVLMVMYRVV